MAIDITFTDGTLHDLTPPSIADEASISAMNIALQPQIAAVATEVITAILLPRIDGVGLIPEGAIDAIAWSIRFNELDVWRFLPVASKRVALAGYLKLLKCSGTRFAVRRIFDVLGITGVIFAWWEDAAPAHTYRIELTEYADPSIDFTYLEPAIREWCRRFAPARARLTAVTFV